MKRIAVLFHENERHPAWYVVHHLAEFWREDGHEVVYVHGTRKFVPADLVLVHVDLSVVPTRYLAFAARYPIAVNGRVADIRKSRISRQLVRPGDGWSGPVIVKSDLNYFGKPERELRTTRVERRFPRLRRLRERVEALGRRPLPSVESMNYEIFDSVAALPPVWFDHPDAVVERFLPEVEDGRYHLRIFQVLGDRWRCLRLASDQRVIKANRSLSTEEIEPHDEVWQWRREFDLDYGKIDYVVVDGRPVLLDLNKTIGATSASSGYRDAEQLARNRRHLAEGLYRYFD